MSLRIKNARALLQGAIKETELLIENEKITHIGSITTADETLDAHNMLLLPGAVDVHVHCRDLGESHKEDWYTASCAALHGGATTIVDQPNTVPPTNDIESLKMKLSEASQKSVVDYAINAGVSSDNLDKLSELWSAGVNAFGEIFMYSTPSETLKNALKIIQDLNGIACIHAEDMRCIQENPGRPIICEEKALGEVLGMTQHTHTNLHVCHLSSIIGLSMIKDYKKVFNTGLSCEVTPHHLFLNQDDLQRLGTYGKMNPPLRRKTDTGALWQGLADGSVDIIASDHAPHTVDEKDVEYEDAPSGVPGVETMLPLMLSAVEQGHTSISRCAEALCTHPASTFGMQDKGEIAVGKDADLLLVDMHSETKIKADRLHDKTGWTPYEGMGAVFPHTVIMRGVIALRDYEMQCEAGLGKFIPGVGVEQQHEKKS